MKRLIGLVFACMFLYAETACSESLIYDGEWKGSAGQYNVSFVVSDNSVKVFAMTITTQNSSFSLSKSSSEGIPISNNSFTFTSGSTECVCEFVSETSCNGTWSSSYDSGTWKAEKIVENGEDSGGTVPPSENGGYFATPELWIRAVINTDDGPIDGVFYKGGEKVTDRGDKVIWGYFYADPSDVSWGDEGNPDLYVKIWFDITDRIDVNFFHVSVPDIDVYSDYPYNGSHDEHGTATMDNRYIRHEYWKK